MVVHIDIGAVSVSWPAAKWWLSAKTFPRRDGGPPQGAGRGGSQNPANVDWNRYTL